MIPNKESDDSWPLIHEPVVLDEWLLASRRNVVPSSKGRRGPAKNSRPLKLRQESLTKWHSFII